MKKLYFSISEVANIIDEEAYTLRYWEKKFPVAKPKKSKAGRRVYTESNIATFQLIKKLIRNEKFTILGTQKILSEKLSNVLNNKLNTNNSDDAVIFTREEFAELIETLQLLILYMKSKK